jgi:3-deoxy-manno-octulosonate cytidylyltransferase (CMP-KDO synthetase)
VFAAPYVADVLMIPGSLGVVPARLGSSRLPRKPLHRLAGRPLIEWVWSRVDAAGVFEQLVVATDSDEVAHAVRAFGGRVEMTDPGHPSGTDRVAEVAQRAAYRNFPLIVNVQGDEPFIRETDLHAAAALVAEDGWEVGTVASPVGSLSELHDPAVVKVVRDDRGGALYFSRAPVPFPRDAEPGADSFGRGVYLRHLGLYAYSREALLRWVALPEAELERIEKLEQLRPLAAGFRIGISVVPPGEGGVDTPEDAERAGRRLLEHLASGAATRS